MWLCRLHLHRLIRVRMSWQAPLFYRYILSVQCFKLEWPQTRFFLKCNFTARYFLCKSNSIKMGKLIKNNISWRGSRGCKYKEINTHVNKSLIRYHSICVLSHRTPTRTFLVLFTSGYQWEPEITKGKGSGAFEKVVIASAVNQMTPGPNRAHRWKAVTRYAVWTKFCSVWRLSQVIILLFWVNKDF